MTHARIAALAGAVVLAALAMWGGEYGTLDWLTIRRQLAEERGRVDALKTELDSLTQFARDLDASPVVQERVAREEFGMIRDGEVLYRVVPR